MSMAESISSRKYGIVVWGATGFTGFLTAAYIYEHSIDGMKIAIAGRNQQRLEEVKDKIQKQFGTKEDKLDILVGDIRDQASLDCIVRQTRVVVSTAGPFLLIGTPIVEACVRNGTHYCDITGETHWIKEMRDTFDEQASRTGAIIVHSCGMDCIPTDIGVLCVSTHAKQRYDVNVEEVKCVVTKFKVHFGGGSIASLCNSITSGANRQVNKDPYYLVKNPPQVARQREPISYGALLAGISLIGILDAHL